MNSLLREAPPRLTFLLIVSPKSETIIHLHFEKRKKNVIDNLSLRKKSNTSTYVVGSGDWVNFHNYFHRLLFKFKQQNMYTNQIDLKLIKFVEYHQSILKNIFSFSKKSQ